MKLEHNWKYKSLLNLEKISDHSIPEDTSRLVRRCNELLRFPLNEFTIEDLRLMIGQQFSLVYLIPLAIEKLNDDLFAEGDFYPGDLLAIVLKIDPIFWKENQEIWIGLNKLISNRKDEIEAEGISTKMFNDSQS